jgi:hypothetical protein
LIYKIIAIFIFVVSLDSIVFAEDEISYEVKQMLGEEVKPNSYSRKKISRKKETQKVFTATKKKIDHQTKKMVKKRSSLKISEKKEDKNFFYIVIALLGLYGFYQVASTLRYLSKAKRVKSSKQKEKIQETEPIGSSNREKDKSDRAQQPIGTNNKREYKILKSSSEDDCKTIKKGDIMASKYSEYINSDRVFDRADAARKTDDVDEMWLLSEDESAFVRDFLVNNKLIPVELLVKLSEDRHRRVRAEVAKSGKIAVEMLEKLSRDKSEDVRAEVALNYNTPKKLLKHLRDNDESVLVRHNASQTLWFLGSTHYRDY